MTDAQPSPQETSPEPKGDGRKRKAPEPKGDGTRLRTLVWSQGVNVKVIGGNYRGTDKLDSRDYTGKGIAAFLDGDVVRIVGAHDAESPGGEMLVHLSKFDFVEPW